MPFLDSPSKGCTLPSDLNYFVPFLMYRVMAKGLRQATSDFAEIGLNVPEARVMIVLLQHRGRIRAGALAEITCIEASALSHILRRLNRRHFISRERVQSDNRSVEVTLTEEGRRAAEFCSRASKSHEKVLLRRFDAGQRDLLRELLTQMYENAAGWPANGDYLALKPAEVPVAPPARRRRRRTQPA